MCSCHRELQQFPEANGKFELVHAFQHHVDVPNNIVAVSLMRFTDIDPPFDSAEQKNAEFRELTGLRMVHPVELELLQKVYKLVMG